MQQTLEADVCVVGSGVAGAIVAAECLDAGQSVVMLEAGPPVDAGARRLRLLEKSLRSTNAARMRIWYRNHRYLGSDFQSRGSRQYSLDGLAVLARGGSTLGWTGFAYRMMPEDFKWQTLTGIGQDWPLDYADLEPFYELAESTLQAKGNSSDAGHPPRSTAFPNEVAKFPRRDQAFLDLFADRGWSTMHHNSALSSDGSIFAATELVDALESDPDFTLVTDMTATQVVSGSASEVSAVRARSSISGDEVVVRAASYAICAGGVETPTLLLHSTDRWHPDGIGNHSGHLGRHLISHSGVNAGVYPKKARARVGPIGPSAASRQFDTGQHQAAGKYIVMFRPNAKGALYLNACVEQPPEHDNRIVLGIGKTRLGSPKPYVYFNQSSEHKKRILEIGSQLGDLAKELTPGSALVDDYVHAHPMCTTRMSSEPGNGVVDKNLRVHSSDNLYLCGSAVFTTGAAAHPTVTIAALAHRLGRHIGQTASV